MATLKGLTRDKVSPSYRGDFMIDTVRGVLRVRKWPRKRGTPKSALQRWWNEWFRQANRLAKYVDGASAARAIEITKDSGMYPRDILLAAMRGRLYTWTNQYGKKWHSMAATQDISNSLDVLAQTVGDILVRATDRWRAPPPGDQLDVLINQGTGASPTWGPVIPATLLKDGAVVNKSANQSIPHATFTALTFDQELYDTDNIHDNVTLNTRFTIPAGWGLAQLCGNVFMDNAAGGTRIAVIARNGVTPAFTPQASQPGDVGTKPALPLLSAIFTASPPDYFEILAYQDSGAALNVLAVPSTWFAISRIV